MHATLLGNHDDAPYTIRSRPGQVEKHANAKPPPGSTGTTPAAPLPGRHHTTTSRKSTHNNTKGSGLNKPPQNPGFDTPAKGHCTRYVALHPLRRAAPVTWRCTRYVALHPNRRGALPTDRVQCLHIGCTTPRHKLRCGPARMEVDGSARLGCDGQRRTPNNQQGPAASPNNQQDPAATHPQQPTGPSSDAPPDSQPGPAATNPQQLTAPAATHPQQPTGPGGDAVQTAGWARRRQGLTGLRDDEPSGRLATQTTSGPPSARLAALRGIKPGPGARAASSPGASLPRHQARARRSRGVEARARGTHATNPGPGRAHDEAGTRRAKQRRGPRPRQQVRPGDPP